MLAVPVSSAYHAPPRPGPGLVVPVVTVSGAGAPVPVLHGALDMESVALKACIAIVNRDHPKLLVIGMTKRSKF